MFIKLKNLTKIYNKYIAENITKNALYGTKTHHNMNLCPKNE